MFFRREKPHVPTFDEHVRNLEKDGFQVERRGNGVRAKRGFCAADITPGDSPTNRPGIGESDILIGDEIAVLVSRGYQMTLETASGKKTSAQAVQLKTLHAFQEDLRESLGLDSLYNFSLGTVSTKHRYDRVEHREDAAGPRPWELKKQQPSA